MTSQRTFAFASQSLLLFVPPPAFIPACSVSSPSFLSLSLSAFYSLVYAVPLFSFRYFRTICFVLLLDAVALCAQLSASAIF